MLKRDISAQFLSNLAQVAILLVASVIIARALGPEGRGLLAMALLIPSIVTSLAALGQESVNSTFPGLYKEQRAALFLQTFVFTAFGAVVSVLITYGFFWLPVPHGNFASLSADVILASCMIAPLAICNGLLLSLLRGVGRVVTSAVLGVVGATTTLVLLFVLLVLCGYGVLAAVWATAVSPLPASLLAVWYLRREIDPRAGRLAGWLLVRSLRFGLPICLAMLATILVFRIDQGLLAYLVTKSDQGVYAIAVQLAERIKLLPASIAAAFLPRLANELELRQPQVPAVFRATMVASCAAMLAIGTAGVPAIVLLYGWEFAGAIPPFLILLPGICLLGGSSVLSTDLLARQKSVYCFVVSYGALAVSLLLNLALIPLLGIAGAALAATVTYATGLAMWIVFYVRTSGRQARELVPGWADVTTVWKSGTQLLARLGTAAWPGLAPRSDPQP